MDEREKFIRDCAVLLEDMSKYMDILDELLENPPHETPRRSADDVAEEGLRIWYPQQSNQRQGQ